MIDSFLENTQGINLVDVGSSGNLDTKWKPLYSFLNVIGFDPNSVECERMSSMPHGFRSVQYLPYAISGAKSMATLHKTRSIYCYSLLKPNSEWLKRFSFHELFDVIGLEQIETETLANIDEVQRMDVDVLKTDTQGLELPILRSATSVLDSAFMVETETGFIENYHGETTYAEIDFFMRDSGFLLFDINTSHRIPRDNHFKHVSTGSEQLLWCEAVWLKDYIALAKKNHVSLQNFSREKLEKILILCALQGCLDYGYEIACLGYELKILSQEELKSLESKESWRINSVDEDPKHLSSSSFGIALNLLLRLLPMPIRREIKLQADRSVGQKHLFRF